MKTALSPTAILIMLFFTCIHHPLNAQILVTCTPSSVSYATGTVALDLNTFQATKQDDQIKVGPTATTWLLYYGWAVIDISQIPDAATIVAITFSGVTTFQSITGNDCRIVRLDSDPFTATGDGILTGMSSVDFSGANYVLQNPGPWSVVLNGQAVMDLQTKLSAGVNSWALGFTEYGGNDNYGTMAGYTSALPQIVVSYTCNAPQPNAIIGPAVTCEGDTISYTATGAPGSSVFIWTLTNSWTFAGGQGGTTVQVIAGSDSGSICVSATNGCGTGLHFCDTIGVLPEITGITIGGTANVCDGDQVVFTLMALHATGAQWTVPAGWTILSGQGTLTLTVTTGSNSGMVEAIPFNDCGDGMTGQFWIVVTAVPVVTMSALPPICLNDAPFLLTAGSPAGGTYSGPGVDSPGSLFVPGVAGIGTHSITYMVVDGACIGYSSATIFVDACLGVENRLESGQLSVMPNPNSGFFSVQFPDGTSGVLQLEVIDISGKVLYSFMTDGSHSPLSLEMPWLRPGIHCLKLSKGSKVMQKSFVVQ